MNSIFSIFDLDFPHSNFYCSGNDRYYTGSVFDLDFIGGNSYFKRFLSAAWIGSNKSYSHLSHLLGNGEQLNYF